MQQPLLTSDFLRRAARAFPEKTAVVDGACTLSYHDLQCRVHRWANALTRLGVAKGDRVAILSPNSHWMLESFLAVPAIGAVLVPVNYRLAADDFRYILDHSGTKLLLLDPDYAELVARIRPDLPDLYDVVVLGTAVAHGALPAAVDIETLLAGAPEEEPPDPRLDETDLCTLNYTSGTTARPKGVMLSHRALVCNALDFTIHLEVVYGDVYLHTLPMFHANGWGGVWSITAMGGTHVSLRRIDTADIFALIARHRVTLACAAPTVLVTIAGAPEATPRGLAGLRLATAGAPPPAAVIERVESLGARIIHCYGLTETGPFLTVSESKPEHAGLPLDSRMAIKARQGISQLLADTRVLDDALAEVPHDGRTIGEVCARGHVLMTGYYNQPDETARAFRGGWFHSGDLAVVHPDGYIEIVDRRKDVIISGGENISSVEVEGVLYRHPAILEVAVIGVPDEKWGEVPRAMVVLRPGAHVSADDIVEFARAHMAHFKAPKGVDFLPALPKTATGKTQKFALREPFWAGRATRVSG